jgi:hypothetical protein
MQMLPALARRAPSRPVALRSLQNLRFFSDPRKGMVELPKIKMMDLKGGMVISHKNIRQEVVTLVVEKGISQTGVKYTLVVRDGPGAAKKEHRVRITDSFQVLLAPIHPLRRGSLLPHSPLTIPI